MKVAGEFVRGIWWNGVSEADGSREEGVLLCQF